MNKKDMQFMELVIFNLKNQGADFSKPVVFSRRALIQGIKKFYNFSMPKTIAKKGKFLTSEGMFHEVAEGFLISEKAKGMFK